ncbi:43kDa postsynaptic protein, partial [Trema orientale]
VRVIMRGLVFFLSLATAAIAALGTVEGTSLTTLDLHTKRLKKDSVNLPFVVGVTLGVIILTIALVVYFMHRCSLDSQPDTADVEIASAHMADPMITMESFSLSTYPYEGQGTFDVGCSICIHEFAHGESIRIAKCGHPYHSKCIEEWLRKGGSLHCPYCRSEF